MKVAISVQGRFHAFYLAQQMLRRDALTQLITSYPKWEVAKFNIPKTKVTSFARYEVMKRVWKRLPETIKPDWNPQYSIHEHFDRTAAKALQPGADLFVGWSSNSLHSIRRAKSMGMIGVVERGSSHMLHQQQILNEEGSRFGISINHTHPRVIEKELMEYEEADYIAVPSMYVRRTFIEHGIPEGKLIHVPYGVDLDDFYPITKTTDTFRIIHCGGLTLRKGVHYLVQAFYELHLPDAELWLVGTVADEIKPFLARYQSPNIIVHGAKPQSELRWYYNQADVFCLASIEEGLALVLVQAMSCGLSVICTTNTGGEDIICESQEGFIIPIRNMVALKEKIEWCYEHQERCHSMGRAARTRVTQGFSWDDYGERIFRAYTERYLACINAS